MISSNDSYDWSEFSQIIQKMNARWTISFISQANTSKVYDVGLPPSLFPFFSVFQARRTIRFRILFAWNRIAGLVLVSFITGWYIGQTDWTIQKRDKKKFMIPVSAKYPYSAAMP